MPSDNTPPHPSVPDFMQYPYPETEWILTHLEALSGVKEETKRCITNLLNYRAVRTRARLPRGASAAVLVPLFVGRSGDLYVVLSRRSDALRTFAGDTALPGGKVDPQDLTVEDTARREAFEEIGMPQDKKRVPLLCVLEPHLARGEMLVTPVIVLVLDYGLQPILNSSEVTSIFAQPLVSFLSSVPHLSSGRAPDLDNRYHTFTDIPSNAGGTIRLHRFLTGREGEGIKPVFALTAAILIRTATIGYGRTPEFEFQPSNAPTPAQQITHALLTSTNPLRIACNQEGIDANETAARLLRPPKVANAVQAIERADIGTRWKKFLGRVDVDVNNGEQRLLGVTPPSRSTTTLGEALDDVRGTVNRQMKEAKSNERKLVEARRAHPWIRERVRNWIVEQTKKRASNADGSEGGGEEGTRGGSEETKTHIDSKTGTGDDDGRRDPRQTISARRKRDAKL